jgi:hypothetical protein
VNHDWSTAEAAGVTLVSVRVRNEASVARRVRVRNVLDGPTLPPRERGVPERGWSGDRFEGVVPAGGERTLGYACPAPRGDDPPVAVESLGRASTADDGVPDEADADAAAAVRMLGRARPPADAVPGLTDAVSGPDTAATPDTPSSGCADSADADSADDAVDDDPADDDSEDDPADDDSEDDATDDDSVRSPTDQSRPDSSSTVPSRSESRRPLVDDSSNAPVDAESTPPFATSNAVWAWLNRVEGRVRRAERLTDASAAEATAVLDDVGGYAGVASLPNRVAADEATLRAVAERAETLADRAADTAAEDAVESLGGLA